MTASIVAVVRAKRGAPSATASTSFIRQLARMPMAMASAATAGPFADAAVVVIEIVSASTSVRPSTAPATRNPLSPNARPTPPMMNSTT